MAPTSCEPPAAFGPPVAPGCPAVPGPPAGDPPRRPAGFFVEPVTAACGKLLDRGDHALIGVSAGNGYFSAPRMAALLKWACGHFARVDVVYADLFVDTMLMAAGETPEKARSHARKQIKSLVRRIERALDEVGAPESRVRAQALSECVHLPGYKAVQRRVREQGPEQDDFDRVCEEHVLALLHARSDGARSEAEMEAMLRAGLEYLHAELPLLIDTPEVLNVPTSVCCYHKLLPALPGLERSSVFNHAAQGHALVRPHDE